MSGRVIAFYGFKGGAGRSFLLANTAALLSALGRRVLIIDADLEAPGLGDFFDTGTRGQNLKTRALASEWRLKQGFLDLMGEITSPAYIEEAGETLGDQIRAKLDPKTPGKTGGVATHDYLSEVGPPSAGQIFLMGAGSHAVSAEEGSFAFLGRILDLDLSYRVQSGGDVGLAALKEVLQSDLFDDVLIDGRTGYNEASMVAIQNLATDVVMVGTSSMQSLDGMARMRALFTGPEPEEPELTAHLVISKGAGSTPDARHQAVRAQANRVKRHLNEDFYHRGHKILNLPFVEDFVTGESHLFRRSGFDTGPDTASQGKGDAAGAPVQIEEYKARLLEFLTGLVGSDRVNGHPLDQTALTQAYNVWSAAQPEDAARPDKEMPGRQSVRQTFGDALTPLSEAEVREASETAIAAFERNVETYLQTVTKTSADTNSHQTRPDADMAAALQDAFHALRVEERALAQALVERRLRETGDRRVQSNVRKILSEALHLRMLPHIVTRAQVRAQTNFDSPEPEPDPETEAALKGDSAASGDAMAQGGHVAAANPATPFQRSVNRRNLRALCRRFLNLSEDKRAEFEGDLASEHNTTDPDYVAVITVLQGLLTATGTPDARALNAYRDLLAGNTPYLPQTLDELREYNLLDVGKRLLSQRSLLSGGGLDVAAVIATVREGITCIERLGASVEEADEKEVSNYLIDCLNWIEIWSGASVMGSDLCSTTFPDYPQPEDLAWMRAMVAGVATAKHAPLPVRLRAMVLQMTIGLILDDGDGVHDLLDQAQAMIVENDLPTADSRLQQELGAVQSVADSVMRNPLVWRIQRLQDAAKATGRDDTETGGLDFATYTNTTVTAINLGLAVPMDPAEFPRLPKGLVASDRAYAEEQVGWFRLHVARNFGRFREVIEALEPTKSVEETAGPEAAGQDGLAGIGAPKLLLLGGAYAGLGQTQQARAAFDAWRDLVQATRIEHYKEINGLYGISAAILSALLATGDLDGFDAFEAETRRPLPRVLHHNLGRLEVERALIVLKRAAQERPEFDRDIARQAARLIAQGLAHCARLSAPTDKQFAAIFGAEWDGLGAFSGHETPKIERAGIANMLLDGLELLPAPEAGHLAIVERLIWGNDARARGKIDTPQADPFLLPLAPALCRPVARLECLRAARGLPAALEAGETAIGLDCGADLNGPARAVFYPEQLRGALA